MFAFDKYLTPFLTPIGAAIVVLLLCWLLLVLRLRRTGTTLLLLATIALYVASTPAFASWLNAGLEGQYPPLAVAQSPTADVIVLLGGATDGPVPPRQEPQVNEHANRILHAAALYKAGKAPLIIASGGTWARPSLGRPESADMSDLLTALGVPVGSILQEGASQDTGENARFTATLMQQHHLTTALLVTSGFHMPRAVAAFRQAGINVIPSEADIYAIADNTDWPALAWLPDTAALKRTGEALHELIGLAYYRLRGWA